VTARQTLPARSMRTHAVGGFSAQLDSFGTIIMTWCVLQVAGQQGAYVARMINRGYTMGESHCQSQRSRRSGMFGAECTRRQTPCFYRPSIYQVILVPQSAPCCCC
jgi:hypothetical protein